MPSVRCKFCGAEVPVDAARWRAFDAAKASIWCDKCFNRLGSLQQVTAYLARRTAATA